jgi:hypothetical protein
MGEEDDGIKVATSPTAVFWPSVLVSQHVEAELEYNELVIQKELLDSPFSYRLSDAEAGISGEKCRHFI